MDHLTPPSRRRKPTPQQEAPSAAEAPVTDSLSDVEPVTGNPELEAAVAKMKRKRAPAKKTGSTRKKGTAKS